MMAVWIRVGVVELEGSGKILVMLKISLLGFGDWWDVRIEVERSSILDGEFSGC